MMVEKRGGVKKRRADDGIAADADASRLADAELRQLMDGLIGECAAAADDADISLLVNAARHDADLAFAGRNDTGTVRADEARFLGVHHGDDAPHVTGADTSGQSKPNAPPTSSPPPNAAHA